MSAARDEILARVRSSTGSTKTSEPRAFESSLRPYRHTGTLSPEERIDLFIDRLHDYGATCHRTRRDGIAEAVERAMRADGKTSLLIPAGIAQDWLPAGFVFQRDENLSYHAIDSSEGVLTGCAGAIALSGTIILHHTASEGRRALTLIPDYHLCVVFEAQIVETVPEAIARMRELGQSPLTTVSGPSATSDIEMTRIKGVHGPRTLAVILAQ